VVIILSLCIPLAFIAGGFVAFKGVQLGLKWQIQTTKQETPTLEIKNPIQPIVEQKQAFKQGKEMQNILDEWVNGAEEK
jgi:hypothetical protein